MKVQTRLPKKTLKEFLLLVVCITLATFVQAQNSGSEMANRFTRLSPSASSLYKSVNFPVSYATGLVDISLPLFDVIEGDLTLPISISYRSSGLKINDPAGLVGMGWSLNAEPAVSRQVKGKPDEGGLGGNGYLNNENIGASIQVSNYNYLYDFSKGLYDEEPDDFYYRTLKRTGQFFYKRRSLTNSALGYDIVNNPIAPVRITRSSTGFSIIESDGTTYTYPNTNAETTSTSSGGYKSAWKVSEINSVQGGGRLNFSYYDDDSREHHFSFTNNVTVEDFVGAPISCLGSNYDYYCGMSDFELPSPVIRRYYGGIQTLSFIGQNANGGSLVDICSTNGTFNSLSQTDIAIKKLKEINFSQGKLVFEYLKRADNYSIPSASHPSRDSYMLKRILVYSRTSGFSFEFKKEIEFHQSGDWNREMLDSINVFDSSRTIVERYKFTYDNSAFPAYPYARTDHWGYLNNYIHSMGANESGVIFDNVTIPFNYCMAIPFDSEQGRPDSISILLGDQSKEAHALLGKARMLTNIEYPSGGSTSFVYELNKWKTASNKIIEGGGMRIKEIQNYDGSDSPPLIRSFRYGKNEDGMGIGDEVGINDYVYNKNYTHQLGNGDIRLSSKRTFMVNPIISYSFPVGTSVVYDYVHEYIGTPTNSIGKTTYQFNYSHDYLYSVRRRYSESSPMIVDFRTNHLWGQLLAKWEYGFESGYVLKRKQTNTFVTQFDPSITSTLVRQIYCSAELAGSTYINPGQINAYSFQGNVHSISPSKSSLVEESVTEYVASGDSTVTRGKIEYEPSNLHFPRRVISYNSSGDSVVTEKRYPTDFSNQPILTTMKALNIVEPLIEETSYKNGSVELSKITTEYIQSASGHILKSAIYKSISGGPLHKEAEFIKHGLDGRIYESVFKESLMSSYLWGLFRNHPAAEAKNAQYDEIAFEAYDIDESYSKIYIPAGVNYISGQNQPIGSFSIDVWNNDRYKFDLDLQGGKVYVVSFWIKNEANLLFNPSNPVAQIISDEISREVGEWKYRQIRFKNVDGYLELLFNTSGCYINGLIIHPADAQLTTYTYDPLVGMTSATDVSGKTVYYEYDSFQRLKQIRDQEGKLLNTFDYHYKE